MGESERSAYNHPGTVITASAGDSGYLNWDYVAAFLTAPEMPDTPASLPDVVAVGGTSLTQLKPNGTRKSESVWNDSGRPSHKEFKRFSASGGGCSTLFEAPLWQQSAPGWVNAACETKRLDNDISAVADPYTGFDVYDTYIYEPEFTPGWVTVGGTSLSSPLIAALYALAGGSHGVNYPAATLYTHLGEPSALYDVSTGGNGYCDGEEPGSCGEPAGHQPRVRRHRLRRHHLLRRGQRPRRTLRRRDTQRASRIQRALPDQAHSRNRSSQLVDDELGSSKRHREPERRNSKHVHIRIRADHHLRAERTMCDAAWFRD